MTTTSYGRGQYLDLNSKLPLFDRHFGCASNSCLWERPKAVPRGPWRYKVGRRVWIHLVLSILEEVWSCSIDRLWKRQVKGSFLIGQKEPNCLQAEEHVWSVPRFRSKLLPRYIRYSTATAKFSSNPSGISYHHRLLWDSTRHKALPANSLKFKASISCDDPKLR